MLASASERFPRGGALLMGLMGTAGTLSIQFVLPFMGKVFDAKKIEAAGGDQRGPLQRLLGELRAIGRVRAVAAEREEVVEVGALQLDVGRLLNVAGGESEEYAVLDQLVEQLDDAVLDLEAGRVLDLLG